MQCIILTIEVYIDCKIKKTHGPSFSTRSRIVASVLFDFLSSSTTKKKNIDYIVIDLRFHKI